MNYIIVEVYLPMAEKSYDIKVSRTSKVWEVTNLIATAITDLSEGLYKATEESILIDRETGSMFNINLSVEEVGFVNGSKLILI